MRLIFALGALGALAALLSPQVARADTKTCDAKDFAAAVDQSGASLRAMTARDQPKLQEKLRRYKEAKKLGDADYENSAFDAIQDEHLEELDQTSSALLMKVDTLGRVPPGTTADCNKLDQVKSASAELDAVIKAKSDYMLKRLDEQIALAEAASGPSTAKAPEEPTAQSAGTPEKPVIKNKSAETKPAETKAAAETSLAEKKTAAAVAPKPSQALPAAKAKRERELEIAAAPPINVEPNAQPLAKPNDAYSPAPAIPAEDGYSIEEVRDATRGFFGTISTNLATVIEHVFKQTGRPTAYVLGTEGGGAFIAGFRYGQGTLYMRSMPGTRKVYWHGPSLGTDLGASGSRTMFLIYRMHEPDALYRGFTGIDGSAYFVGGVGVTLLKGGDVIMAPIRSGVGLRFGANVGYVRFTDTATWNPF